MPEPPKDQSYEVGYGRPPKAHRFKPGQSGNPRGRPKKKKESFDEVMNAALAQKVLVRDAEGHRLMMTKSDAVIASTLRDAIKGNPTARKLVFDHFRQQGGPEPIDVTPYDERLFEERQRALAPKPAEPEEDL